MEDYVKGILLMLNNGLISEGEAVFRIVSFGDSLKDSLKDTGEWVCLFGCRNCPTPLTADAFEENIMPTSEDTGECIFCKTKPHDLSCPNNPNKDKIDPDAEGKQPPRKTEEDYIKEWIALGARYNYGYRVCKHITNSYKDKYRGVDYAEALLAIRKEAEKKLVEVNRAHKFGITEFVRLISKDPRNIDDSDKIIGVAKSQLVHLYGYIEKVGYYRSIISACKYLKPEELEDWVKYAF